MKHLIAIQSELKAPKGQFNDYGKYKYRSAEDILEAVKPILKKHDCMMLISDDAVCVDGRHYIKATITLKTPENTFTNSAFAQEPEVKKGMDASQISGTASSYARKYALNGLFLIDDTKDADTNEHREEVKARAAAEPSREQQINKIMALCDMKGTTIEELCSMSKVNSLDELSDARIAKAIQYLENR